jgi:hypothetical protein
MLSDLRNGMADQLREIKKPWTFTDQGIELKKEMEEIKMIEQ